MSDFFDFYQFGGFFNNIVSLFALAGVATLVLHAVHARRPDIDGRLLALVDRLAALGIASGVLGVLFNCIEMGNALATLDASMHAQALARGGAIVPIPLVWALLCAIPLWVATTVYRHRLAGDAR